MLIKNGLIHDAIKEEAYVSDILVTDGKIIKIAKDIEVKDEEVIDATGLEVFPGLIDAHSHLGLDGYGIGYERQDYNEMNDIVSSQLRAIDAYNPMDPAVKMAHDAGITTVCTGPGSANALGGTFIAVKTIGKRVDDVVINDSVAMKCAFGENPKRCYKDKGDSTRMSTAAHLRSTLYKALEYKNKKEAAKGDVTKLPSFDLKLEALIPVLNREIPLKAHAHSADDIFTAIRIAKEFNVKLTLEHVTEGHLISDELAKEDLPMAIGPSFPGASKFELKDKSFTTPGILSEKCSCVSIITDAPVIPEEYLPLCAGLAIQSGMKPFKALQAITINPAKHIGISDIVGSLEVGKDADIILVKGNLFDVNHEVVKVIVNGKLS